MKIISLNVGRPQLVVRNDEPISTGIFKSPVEGRVMMRTLNLDGDRQADLTVHGGPYKAVYVYPSEHYDFWKNELPEMDLPWGMFGENLTVEGLQEKQINIGDTYKIGEAVVQVTQPRQPLVLCTKTLSLDGAALTVNPAACQNSANNREFFSKETGSFS